MRSLPKKGAMMVLGISTIVFPIMTAMAYTTTWGELYTVIDPDWAKPDPNNANSYTIGTVSTSVSDTVYTYTENFDCAGDQWTLVPGASVTTTNFNFPNGSPVIDFTESNPTVTINGNETPKAVHNDVVMISKISGPPRDRQLPDGTWVREILTSFQNWGFKTEKVVVTANNTKYPLYPPVIALIPPAPLDNTGGGWQKGTPVVICTKGAASVSSSSSSSESSESSSSSSYSSEGSSSSYEVSSSSSSSEFSSSWSSSEYSSVSSSMSSASSSSEESSSSSEASSSSSYSSSYESSSSSFSSVSYCGNMMCEASEDAMNCPSDCGYSSSSSSYAYSSSEESSSSSYSSMY